MTEDQFVILRELGRGGTSVVYLVADRENRSLCAMKTLRRDGPGTAPQALREESGQLCAEAAALRELGEEKEGENRQEDPCDKSCPGIPQYKGEVTDENGDFAGFLMEYVEGRSLQELLEEGKVYSVREAAQAGLQLCGILARLHRCSPPMIYRDLKPANIMVRPDGTLVLVDYGAVRKYRKSAASDTSRLGTEGYAAPEQYGGWEQSDERTDVYGIGAVLHHMITGRSPLETGLRPLEEILSPADRGPNLSSAGCAQMGKILMGCCMTAPAMRYPSCGELEKALQELLKTCDTETCDTEGKENRFLRRLIFLKRFPGRVSAGRRFSPEKAIRGLSRVWKKYLGPICVTAGLLLYGGTAVMVRETAEKKEYRTFIEKAQEEGSPEKKREAYRMAAALCPGDAEVYICFAKDLAGDNVITHKEKEALESFLYTEGDPERMRESRPGEYARLQTELGKIYFACYEGGTQAAAVCFRNALECGGLWPGGRRSAEAMTLVLGEEWTADRIYAWRMLEKEALREAEKTGDGLYAAAVCKGAAAEIALHADRYEQSGAGEGAIREVIQGAERFLSEAQSGKLQVPDRSKEELATALQSAARGEERQEKMAGGKAEGTQSGAFQKEE